MKNRMGGPNEDDFFRRWKLFLLYANSIVIWVHGQLVKRTKGMHRMYLRVWLNCSFVVSSYLEEAVAVLEGVGSV